MTCRASRSGKHHGPPFEHTRHASRCCWTPPTNSRTSTSSSASSAAVHQSGHLVGFVGSGVDEIGSENDLELMNDLYLVEPTAELARLEVAQLLVKRRLTRGATVAMPKALEPINEPAQ